jgi:hypothetical protein
MAKYPMMSPYVAFNNNPVYFVDPLGLEGEDWIKREGSNTWEWDGEVSSQKEATDKYGQGTEWAKTGHTYKADDGTYVELLDNGNWQRISEETFNNINRDDSPVNSNVKTESYFESEIRYQKITGTHQAWTWTGATSLLLLADDVTVIGVADDPLIIGAAVIGFIWWLTTDNTNVTTIPYTVSVPKTRTYKTDEQFYYVTYTKTNSTTGEVYVGRTSGYGSPQTVVNARDVNHHMTAKGFGDAVVSTSLPATISGGYLSRAFDPSYHAIRGSEQLQIEAYRKLGISGNSINGISPTNKEINTYFDAARRLLGY